MARKRPETTIYLGEGLHAELERYRQSLPGPPSSSGLVREALRQYLERVAPANGSQQNGLRPPSLTPPAPPPRAAGFRETEDAWRERNAGHLREQFPGQWVVIEGEEVVAAGHELGEVAAAARQRGIPFPYVIFVDPRPSEVLRMGL